MDRSNISIGPFTLLVNGDGSAWVAPGGAHIKSKARAEEIAHMMAVKMGMRDEKG